MKWFSLVSLCAGTAVLSTVICQAAEKFPPLADEPLSFESVYQPLTIKRENEVVVMKTQRKGTQWNYSGVYLKDPKEIVLTYTRHFFLLPVFKENPQRVLLIGLGGGGINALINAAYPKAVMESVEIDPMVYELAQRYMKFQPGPSNVVHVQDGRMFVKRTKEKYDWVILDAFRGGDIPAHLKTKEFYREIRSKMSPDGILVSNLIQGNELFSADVATLRASFPQVLFFRSNDRGNAMALAAPFEKPRLQDVLNGFKEDAINPTIRSYVRVKELAGNVVELPATKTAVLTDDFAPAEFLNIQRTE